MPLLKPDLKFIVPLRLLLGLLCTNALAWAETPDTFHFELRYGDYTARPHLLDQTALYRTPLFSWLDGEFGARISESWFSFQSLEYKAEVETNLLSFFSLGLRLSDSWYPANGTASTNFLFTANLHGAPVDFLYLYATFGWYERFISLSGLPVVPRLSRDVPDHDIAMMLGFEVRPTEKIGIGGRLATFEVINTFNLNNPYFQASVRYQADDPWGEFSLYARYRILLGFGRLDEFLIGLGWTIPLQILFPGPSSANPA